MATANAGPQDFPLNATLRTCRYVVAHASANCILSATDLVRMNSESVMRFTLHQMVSSAQHRRVSADACNAQVSPDSAIRRANLQRLVRQRGWAIDALRTSCGWGSYSFWRDLLHNPKKSFGEKVARRIEEALNLGRLWLDDPALPVPPAQIAEPPGRYSIPTEPAIASDVLAECDRLDDDGRRRLDAVLRAYLGMRPRPTPE